jgi:hypothetical protein
MKRYQEGGGVGYEENPKPGRQSDMPVTKRTKTVTRDTSPRKISPMEFLQEYESGEPSARMREEAKSELSKRRSNPGLPGDRATDFKEQRGIARGAVDIDQESTDRALKSMAAVASAVPAARGASAAAKGLKLAKRRYDVGKRVLNMPEKEQRIAFLKAAREAKEVDGMKRGGAVKSFVSSRLDGIAQRGKTRGRFV